MKISNYIQNSCRKEIQNNCWSFFSIKRNIYPDFSFYHLFIYYLLIHTIMANWTFKWKHSIYRVFDHLWVLRNHSGLVMFLEEDHYVSEDFLHMLLLLERATPQTCPQCSVITLGNYLKNYNFGLDSKKVGVPMV